MKIIIKDIEMTPEFYEKMKKALLRANPAKLRVTGFITHLIADEIHMEGMHHLKIDDDNQDQDNS